MKIPDENLFKNLVQEVREYSIMVIDLSGHIISWNNGAERFFDYTEDEILGKHFSVLYTEREKQEKVPEDMLKEARQHGKTRREGWRVRKDNSEFWGKVILAQLHDNQNNLIGYSKVTIDMTHIRKAHQINLDRKDEIFSLLTHELKTPLTSISAYSELVCRYIETEKYTEAKEYSEKIHLSVQKLSEFVNELYQVNQNEADSAVLIITEFDICVLIRELIETGTKVHTSHTINAHDCKTPVLVKADKNKIEQVLNNYISNGIKYSPNGTELIIKVYPSRKEIVVGVKDQGIGIPKNQLTKMFKKYQRADNTGKIEGLGLGLYLCRQIIHAHNGEVWIDSEEGEGSSFFFSLPRKNSES